VSCGQCSDQQLACIKLDWSDQLLTIRAIKANSSTFGVVEAEAPPAVGRKQRVSRVCGLSGPTTRHCPHKNEHHADIVVASEEPSRWRPKERRLPEWTIPKLRPVWSNDAQTLFEKSHLQSCSSQHHEPTRYCEADDVAIVAALACEWGNRRQVENV